MIKVLLDTNFLMGMFQLKIDIFTELDRIMEEPFKVAIISQTKEELERLAEGAQKEALPAKMALSLIVQRGIETIPMKEGYADDLLAELAQAKGWYLATNDKELRRRVTKTIFMRQHNHLEKT